MPYINVKTNVPVAAAAMQTLKEQLGKDIELFAGKSEKWLMLGFEPEQSMWFAGSDAPLAMAEVNLFGGCTPEESAAFTAKVCARLSEQLGVASDRIYVKYMQTPYWGWNGSNF